MPKAPDHAQARLRLRYDMLARTQSALLADKPANWEAVNPYDGITDAIECELQKLHPSAPVADTWGEHIERKKRAIWRCCVRDRAKLKSRGLRAQRAADLETLNAFCAECRGKEERIKVFFGAGYAEMFLGGPLGGVDPKDVPLDEFEPQEDDSDDMPDDLKALSQKKKPGKDSQGVKKASPAKVTVKLSNSVNPPQASASLTRKRSPTDDNSDDDYAPDSPAAKLRKTSLRSSVPQAPTTPRKPKPEVVISTPRQPPPTSRQSPSVIVISDDEEDDLAPPPLASTDILPKTEHTSPNLKHELVTPPRRAAIKNEPLSPKPEALSPFHAPGPSSAAEEHASPGLDLERKIASSKRAWEAALAAARTVQTWVKHARTTHPPSVAREIIDVLRMAQRIRVLSLEEEQRVRYVLDGSLPAYSGNGTFPARGGSGTLSTRGSSGTLSARDSSVNLFTLDTGADWDRAEDAAALIAEWIEAMPREYPVEVAERFVAEMKIAERIREVEGLEGWSEVKRMRYILTGHKDS